GRQTASGEILDTVAATAAHRSLPLASYAKVTNLGNGHSVVVKINDRVHTLADASSISRRVLPTRSM
ncbi:MAG TPA: septal ring lytic transglycosylase RlpA family protein, partial [Planctomycetaceae bacterium]|nr:septal ring lytic transglycosylase RlpA family protein [Planctomycetaceae bacterium]